MPTWTARTSRTGRGGSAACAAFTLLETLVALAVTALVLSALAGALRRAAAARERTEDRAERTAATRTLLLRMAREVEAAVASFDPASPDRFVVVAPERGAPSSELRFATGEGTLLAYRVEEGASRLLRAAASRFAPPSTPDLVAVLARVRRFSIRCFDGAEWRTTWTRPGLPRAVELAITVDDGTGGTEELGTTVTLPASES